MTVFCGSESSVAEPTNRGVYAAEAKIFTDSMDDYRTLIYQCEEFPTDLMDITNWRYVETEGYWVNINTASPDYGSVLTYDKFPTMTADQIRQDIVDKFFRDDLINLKGEKYEVNAGSTQITIGTTVLSYAIDADRNITVQTGTMTIDAAYDKGGRSLTVPATYDSFKIDLNGNIAICDSSTPVLESVSQIVLSDGSSSYTLMRNVDQQYAKFQLFQVTFRTSESSNVSVKITKDTAATLNIDINADMSFADCYFSDLQFALLKTIDPVGGDIQPLKYRIEGEYTAEVSDGFGNSFIRMDTLGSRELYVYGTVTDINGSVTGSVVTNPLYGADITYRCEPVGGAPETLHTTVAAASDATGNVEGFYLIKVPYGAKLEITDITCSGYSFDDKKYSYGEIRGDIDPAASPYLHVFKAKEMTDAIRIVDQKGEPAPSCKVEAKYYYYYDSAVSPVPPAAPATPGTLPSGTLTSDKDGYVYLPYSLPTGVDYILVLQAVNETEEAKIVYTFELDDTAWSILPTALTCEGNIIVAASDPSATIGNTIKAREYSFEVDIESKNGLPLNEAGLKASWYYRGTLADSKNTDLLSSIVQPMDPSEYPGRVRLVNQLSDETGAIRVVYLIPHLLDPRWNSNISSAFIYIYGDRYNFDYVSGITSLDTDPVTTGHPGCVCLSYYSGGGTPVPIGDVFPGPYTITSEDSIYTVSGNVTAHSGDLPYSVKLIVSIPGKTTETEFYRDGSALTYSFKAVGGTTPEISMVSEGYSFTNTSPSTGTIDGDKTIDFISDYVGTSSIHRERSEPIGITTGYTVSGVDPGAVIEYTYYVNGADHRTLVKAASTTTVFIVKGKLGLSVSMTADSPDEDYYVGEFDNAGLASAVKLEMKKYVMYKGTTETLLSGPDYKITIFYKGEVFKDMQPNAEGITVMKVPSTDVTYSYGEYTVEPIPMTSGKYAGFVGFDLKDYIPSYVQSFVTVTIEYYATSSIDNLSSAKCEPIVYVDDLHPTKAKLAIGTQKVFTAPKLDGFNFAGWYLNGTYYSSTEDVEVCNFTATDNMDEEVTLHAYYSAVSPKEADKGVDSTVLIIGIIAVVVAVLALVFVVFQNKRY